MAACRVPKALQPAGRSVQNLLPEETVSPLPEAWLSPVAAAVISGALLYGRLRSAP